MEFAEVTTEINELFEINKDISLYENEDDLKNDLAEGYLRKFLKEPTDNLKINLLLNIRGKIRHQQQRCANDCIFCNPDLGNDPFPDFTCNLKVLDPEGSA